MQRPTLTVDLARCIGCQACGTSCDVENELPVGVHWNRVVKKGPKGIFPNVAVHYLPVMCQQCHQPACVGVCPDGAIVQQDDGIVLIQRERCSACMLCADACPFDAIALDPISASATKCTLCSHRLERQELPACVTACPTAALRIEEAVPAAEKRADPRAFALLPGSGVEPAIVYRAPSTREIDWLASGQL